MWVPHPGLLNLSERPHTYLLCFARILKGVFECFNELFSKHSGNNPYSYGKIYVQHPDIPHSTEVVQVKKFKYEVNFDAFFADTMVFYLGKATGSVVAWRKDNPVELRTVVFGQVKDAILVSIHPRRGLRRADNLTKACCYEYTKVSAGKGRGP
jgi:hypothetical protein